MSGIAGRGDCNIIYPVPDAETLPLCFSWQQANIQMDYEFRFLFIKKGNCGKAIPVPQTDQA